MTPQELIANCEAQQSQEDTTLKFEGEPERKFQLVKDGDFWFVDDLKTGKRKTLALRDSLQFYSAHESHDGLGNFQDTCFGQVINMTYKCVTVQYRENQRYLMGNGTKLYNYYPVDTLQQNNNKNILGALTILIGLLVVLITLTLTGWL